MIELRDALVRYGEHTVLDRLSLQIPRGAHIALMGASGVGKTTLLHVIAGLRKLDGGELRLDAQRCGMLFQQPRLLPWCSAAENVNCVLSDTKKTMPQALSWLERLQMAEDADKYPAELSGGMQQRVALARALAFGGELILLDEPFQGLDDRTKQEAVALCRDSLREKTTIFVTHDRRDAQALADIIYTMRPDGLERESSDE